MSISRISSRVFIVIILHCSVDLSFTTVVPSSAGLHLRLHFLPFSATGDACPQQQGVADHEQPTGKEVEERVDGVQLSIRGWESAKRARGELSAPSSRRESADLPRLFEEL